MYVKIYIFWVGSSNFVIINKFLNTWQLLDPAGSRPDPGIEVTYQKSDHVCQILFFWDGNSKFGIKNIFFLHLPWQLLDPADSHANPGMKVT